MDVTYNFTAGTRAVAGQVNQNFADVKSAVDPLQTDVADIKTQLTSGIILPDGSVDFTRLQSYKSYVVSNATNATPIVITAVGHGFLTGDKVYISGVGGNTAANGVFTITKIGTDTFSLDGTVGNGIFTSNGTATIYPSDNNNLVDKLFSITNEVNNLGTVTTETTLATGKVSLIDFSGAVNLVMPSNLPIGIEHIGVVNFTTTSTSSPTILQTTTTKTITGATNASPIVITATGHGYVTGDKVVISGVLGNTNANGTWVIIKLTDNTFSLNGSVGNGAYTSGGTVRKANFKWSSINGGKAPTSFSTITGVRNVLIFRTHDGGSTWECEYDTYGGVETAFIRPILTSDGTIGGASFAAFSSTQLGGKSAYMAFDNNLGSGYSYFYTGGYQGMYNPIPLKVSSFDIVNYTSAVNVITSGSVYASNDGVTYTFLNNFTNSNTTPGATWNLPISEASRGFYKYYKINVATTVSGEPIIIECYPNATYIAT